MNRVIDFFKGVRSELRKVSWPNGSELKGYTITVLATVLFFVIFFAVIDLGISELIRLIP